jgi:hypothetical protein
MRFWAGMGVMTADAVDGEEAIRDRRLVEEEEEEATTAAAVEVIVIDLLSSKSLYSTGRDLSTVSHSIFGCVITLTKIP